MRFASYRHILPSKSRCDIVEKNVYEKEPLVIVKSDYDKYV